MYPKNRQFVIISSILVLIVISDVYTLRSSTKCFGAFFNDIVCDQINSTIDIKKVTFGVSECNDNPQQCCPDREICGYPVDVNNNRYKAVISGCQGKQQCFNTQAARLDDVQCNSVATDFVTIDYECVTDDDKIVPASPAPTTTDPPSNTTTSSREGNKGSGNAGAIAGALIGVLIVIAVLCVIGFFLYRRKKKHSDLSWAADDNNAYISGPNKVPKSIHVVNGTESTTNQNVPGYLEIEDSYATLNENKMLPDIRNKPSTKSNGGYFYPEDEFDDVEDDPPPEPHQYQDPSGIVNAQNNPPDGTKESGKVPKYAKVIKKEPNGVENNDTQGEVYYSPVDKGTNNTKEGMSSSRPSGATSMYDTALPVQENDLEKSDTFMKANSVYMAIED